MNNIKNIEMMKKILHISKYYYPSVGGIENIARDCVNALKESYLERVLCFNEKSENIVEIIDDIEVTRCKCEFLIRSQAVSFSIINELKRIISEWNPDYILIHYPNPYIIHFLLKYVNRIKVIVYWHSDIIKQKILKLFFHHENNYLLKYCYKIIVTSPNYIEDSFYLKKYREKCVIVPNCINENRLKVSVDNIAKAKQICEKNKGKIICFAFGRHVRYKGLDYLIKASKLLDNRFVIYLGGIGKETAKLKKLASADSKVVFLGKITEEQLKEYLIATDIFCFPSITKNEAFGVALAEAMYFSNPAITFNIKGSGVNYVSIHRETGLEVTNRDVNEYAMAMLNLAEDSFMRKKMADNAQKRVEKFFMYSHYVENINSVFRD